MENLEGGKVNEWMEEQEATWADKPTKQTNKLVYYESQESLVWTLNKQCKHAY